MRLIDADKFAIEEPKLWDWSSVDDISSTAVLKQCIWDVQCAPIVHAIPIEWIRQWYKSHDYLTEGKTAICRMIWEWQRLNLWLLNHQEVGNTEQNNIIYDLIKLWEKENE